MAIHQSCAICEMYMCCAHAAQYGTLANSVWPMWQSTAMTINFSFGKLNIFVMRSFVYVCTVCGCANASCDMVGLDNASREK